jgi:hypothetical protein
MFLPVPLSTLVDLPFSFGCHRSGCRSPVSYSLVVLNRGSIAIVIGFRDAFGYSPAMTVHCTGLCSFSTIISLADFDTLMSVLFSGSVGFAIDARDRCFNRSPASVPALLQSYRTPAILTDGAGLLLFFGTVVFFGFPSDSSPVSFRSGHLCSHCHAKSSLNRGVAVALGLSVLCVSYSVLSARSVSFDSSPVWSRPLLQSLVTRSLA